MHVLNFLGGKKCKLLLQRLQQGKPTSLLIQNVDISLNGLITMIKEFMHIVGGFWNPFLFFYGTKLVSVAFMGVNMLK